jgi:hypothetical protein
VRKKEGKNKRRKEEGRIFGKIARRREEEDRDEGRKEEREGGELCIQLKKKAAGRQGRMKEGAREGRRKEGRKGRCEGEGKDGEKGGMKGRERPTGNRVRGLRGSGLHR